jgi:hypothetical protein
MSLLTTFSFILFSDKSVLIDREYYTLEFVITKKGKEFFQSIYCSIAANFATAYQVEIIRRKMDKLESLGTF